MTQYYIGVKIVIAWPEDKNGKQGYAVRYEDGYESWSPADVFERAYFPMGNDRSRVTEQMVESFVTVPTIRKIDEKTALVSSDLITGFVQHETSSCVDPANFDEQIGMEIGLKRIKDSVWKCLGFVVQWGRFGLKN